MRVKTQLKYLDINLKQGVKDPNKYYKTVFFLDGTQSVNILTDDDKLFQSLQGLEQLTLCECELDLSLGRYTGCKLIACQPVQQEVRK